MSDGIHASSGIEARFALTRGNFALDVEFHVAGRGITALFGPSGSGKTTLLRCIAGLERAPEGRCVVAGVTWQDEASGRFLPAHKRPVGYVFQEASLFPHLSVRRNLEYGWKRVPASQRRIAFDSAVEWLGLGGLLERSPATLSGGERQRVAMGRALLTGPELLLADEPLASLDAQSKAEILPYLERLHGELELPFVYVSHSLEEVSRIADEMILLRQGRIESAGPMDRILARIDLPLARSDDAGAIVRAEIVAQDAEFHLTELQFAGGRISVPREDQPVGEHIRLRVLAKDVSGTLVRPERTSILNVIPVQVVESSDDGTGQVLIRLDASGTPLLARITRKSATLLQLRPGLPCFAQIKSVALLA
jgi:molybdate transport system ATP-binding protein